MYLHNDNKVAPSECEAFLLTYRLHPRRGVTRPAAWRRATRGPDARRGYRGTLIFR